MRNSRKSRLLGRFIGEVGTWRGIWKYATTGEVYTDGAGSARCCEWTGPGAGCGPRTTGSLSFRHLDLGSDVSPRQPRAGVYRYGNRDGCPYESSSEPPDAEVFSLKVENYYGINSGSGATKSDGATLRQGWDDGSPDSSWMACSKSVPDPAPLGDSVCTSQWTACGGSQRAYHVRPAGAANGARACTRTRRPRRGTSASSAPAPSSHATLVKPPSAARGGRSSVARQ